MRIFATSLAALAALVFVFIPNGAGADSAKRGGVTIQVKATNNGSLKYVLPDSMDADQTLEIENLPGSTQFGPHTFSIMKRKAIPQGEDERHVCGHYHGICKKIREAHGLFRHDFTAEVDDVEQGVTGWDKGWIKNTQGDSSYMPDDGEEEIRNVETTGSKLWFMCAIHPKLQGSVPVIQP